MFNRRMVAFGAERHADFHANLRNEIAVGVSAAVLGQSPASGTVAKIAQLQLRVA
jgi:hypothetical protein